MTHFFGIIFVPSARKTARPALGAQVFRKQRPKSFPFLAFCAVGSGKIGAKGALERSQERKVGRIVDKMLPSCGLQGSIHHSLVGSLFASLLVSVNRSNRLIRKEALQQGQTLEFPNRERRF
jgi:hypothetical protein